MTNDEREGPDPEQAALIAAVALADAEPIPRNRALARQARNRFHIISVERVEVERGIRPRRPRDER